MEKVLVIGGAGFLGSALAAACARRGLDVSVFDLSPHPELRSIAGDLLEPAAVERACEGVDTVFQTAALVDWGPRSRSRLYNVNVLGNRNVIAACQHAGVRRLIYTSSIDVVFDGRPIAGGSEAIPYPRRHLDDYGRTKMLAEQDVIAANRPGGLLTCSIRTAGIFGPGDRHRFPGYLRSLRSGRAIRLGSGKARFGHLYVENAAHAHLLAADALQDGSPVAGQCYFVDDGIHTNFFDFFEPYLAELGYPPERTSIPFWLAYALAILLEGASKSGLGPKIPALTRYVVLSTCRDFFFSSARAERDFNYRPIVSPEEAHRQTVAWLRAAGWGADSLAGYLH